jgi:hypothetical protein
VPTRETSCPLKKSWKLRWRKERRVAGSQFVFSAVCPEFTDNYPIDPSELPESLIFQSRRFERCPQLLPPASAFAAQNRNFDWQPQLPLPHRSDVE